MSDIEAAIQDILDGSTIEGTQDPSVAMAKPVVKEHASKEVAVTEPKPRRQKNQRKLIPEVEGKVNVDADGTPFSAAVVYPRGYVKLILSKFSKFTVYADELEAMAEWFGSPEYTAFKAALTEAGLHARKVDE